jgi:DinB superfamily
MILENLGPPVTPTLQDHEMAPSSTRRVPKPTLRHLVFIADAWASRTVLDQPMPYHRLGVTQAAHAPADAAALGIDVDARPPLAEVMKARADRLALVRGIVDGLTDTELERMCARAPAPGYPEGSRSVGECLGVVMQEECEHHRFAVRDLAVLKARWSTVLEARLSPVTSRD